MAELTKKKEDIEHEQNNRMLDRISLCILLACTITIVAPTLRWPLGTLVAAIPLAPLLSAGLMLGQRAKINRERSKESAARNGAQVVGSPPLRDAIKEQIEKDRTEGNLTISKYLVGFELESGQPIWISEEDICTHAAIFAKTGVGKTLWMLSLLAQQMARGRASGATFIDAKRDAGTLSQIILMALSTGRIEDLIIIDPFDPVHSYNFVLTTQKADSKSKKILRAGLPPIGDSNAAKHYDRLASDAVYRIVRALEATKLGYTLHDVSSTLSSFSLAYNRITALLRNSGEREALTELSHLRESYTNRQGEFDKQKVGDNLRGIASELQSISGSELGRSINTSYTDLDLTDAMLRGKIIYYMLPRLEEAEAATRMVKIFREDLEVSIGQIISNPAASLEDPHLVMVDEAGSTLGPSWAALFELARKGRFAFIIGAQSIGSLTDRAQGLSKEFMERVLANINLKICMRVGDDETATTLSKWMGMTERVKKSVGRTRTLLNPAEKLKSFANVSVTEEEVEAVSPDSLKHGLSTEKGLAYFDIGDGVIRQGRTLWVDAKAPAQWPSREHLIRHKRNYKESLDLSSWIDNQVLEKSGNDVDKKIETNYPNNLTTSNPQVCAAGQTAPQQKAFSATKKKRVRSSSKSLPPPPSAQTLKTPRPSKPKRGRPGFKTSPKIEQRLLEKGRTTITRVTFNEADFLDD